MIFWLFTSNYSESVSGYCENWQLSRHLSNIPLNAFTDEADTTASRRQLHRRRKNEVSAVNNNVSWTIFNHVLLVSMAEPFLTDYH